MKFIRKFVFSIATIGALSVVSLGALAQAIGNWSTNFGSMAVTRNSSGGLSGVILGVEGGGYMEFIGQLNRLEWIGNWYYQGSTLPRNLPHCGRPLVRNTSVHGQFRVSFNAAENRFEGKYAACNADIRRDLIGQKDFTGTRDMGPIVRAPTGPSVQKLEGDTRGAALDRFIANGASLCKNFSPNFRLNTCIVMPGRAMIVETLVNQTERPAQLVLTGFRKDDEASRSLGREVLVPTNRTVRLVAPFVGTPRAGSKFRINVSGAVCHSDTNMWDVQFVNSRGEFSEWIDRIQPICPNNSPRVKSKAEKAGGLTPAP